MSILEKPYGLASLTESLAGSVVFPTTLVGRRPRGVQPRRSTSSRPRSRSRPRAHATSRRSSATRAANGLRIAPQRTGHNATPIDSLEDVVLLKTDRLDTVEIDPQALRARVGAGVKWEKVVPRASELGLAVLHGSTPDVSIAGYGLGGGLGWYGRKHGLFTNSITAIELVTADGDCAASTRQRARALLGAARRRRQLRRRHGARVPPVPDLAGLRGCPVLPVGALGRGPARLARLDPDGARRGDLGREDPAVPAASTTSRRGCADGRSRSSTRTRSAPRRRASSGSRRSLGPRIDTVRMVPPVELSEMHMDPPDPLPYFGEHLVLARRAVRGDRRLRRRRRAWVRLDAHLGRDPARRRCARPRRRGPRRPRPAAGRVRLLRHRYDARRGDGRHARDLHRVTGTLRPYRSGSYLNFEEDPTDPASFYRAETYRRLRE